MASCKDCLYFDVCKDAAVPNPEYKGEQPDKSKDCRCFKNKADFVEVVRCEKCKYRTEVTECNHTLYFCRKKQNYIKLNDFCSYGEKNGGDTEWINIEDKKPRMNERVIIFIKSSKGLNSHTTVAKLIDEETFLAGEGYFRFNKVTHWQPLPEEPRENTENRRAKNG